MKFLPDILLIGLLVYRPSIGMLAWIAVVITLRHVTYLADEIARMIDAENAYGLTRIVCRFLLPGWTPHAVLMSRTIDLSRTTARPLVHVPIPDTASTGDTTAISYKDDATISDQFLILMADTKDERGRWLFSANQIHAAIGGKRADVLDKIRDRRSAVAPAVYREDDGSTAPATYPVTKP